jgi:hypothetical protein
MPTKHVLQGALGDLSIIGDLGAQPIAVGQPQKPAQAQIGVGGDGTLARDDIPDPLGRHADFLSQPILADPHGLEEFLQQQFSGSHGREFAHELSALLVIIHDFHILGTRLGPAETHPELAVDPDAMLAFAIPAY